MRTTEGGPSRFSSAVALRSQRCPHFSETTRQARAPGGRRRPRQVENAHPRNALAPVGGGVQDRAKRATRTAPPTVRGKVRARLFRHLCRGGLEFFNTRGSDEIGRASCRERA